MSGRVSGDRKVNGREGVSLQWYEETNHPVLACHASCRRQAAHCQGAVIHFDTNAWIALPQWAREGRAIVRRVLNGEAVAVCAVAWYEYLPGPLADGEAELARFCIGQG